MAIACGILEFDYVLHEDRHREEELQTIFHLRTLSWAELELVSSQDIIQEPGGNQLIRANHLQKARRILNYGLLGWERFRRADGSPVDFKACQENGRRWIPDQILDCLHPMAVELANAITERSRLTEEQAKNF